MKYNPVNRVLCLSLLFVIPAFWTLSTLAALATADSLFNTEEISDESPLHPTFPVPSDS